MKPLLCKDPEMERDKIMISKFDTIAHVMHITFSACSIHYSNRKGNLAHLRPLQFKSGWTLTTVGAVGVYRCLTAPAQEDTQPRINLGPLLWIRAALSFVRGGEIECRLNVIALCFRVLPWLSFSLRDKRSFSAVEG